MILQTPLELAVQHTQAHCVTLLRLAMHAQREHPSNGLEDDSFARALREFSDEYEQILALEPISPPHDPPPPPPSHQAEEDYDEPPFIPNTEPHKGELFQS